MRLSLLLIAIIGLITSSHGQKMFGFIANQGQWDAHEKFRADIPGGTIYLENNAITYKLQDISELTRLHTHPSEYNPRKPLRYKSHAYRVEFVNGQAQSFKSAFPSPEYYNYFIGNDQSKWASGIHAKGEIEYQDLYPGVNLKFYTSSSELKYDIIIAPNADASAIKMKYAGQSSIRLKKGQLEIETILGKIVEEKPFAYQIINGNTRAVACNYVLNGTEVSFEFPDGYDEDVEMIIDPTLIFSTNSGSVANNFGMTATYDLNGNLFSGGTVFGNGFPTTLGAYDSTFAGTPGAGITDIIITKYNATGTNQIYSTYIGGAQCETVHSLIINDQDELFLFGLTGSTDYPTSASAYDNTFGGGTAYNSVPNGTNFIAGTDICVSKLSNDGTALLASTYLGGSLNDGMNYNDAQVSSNLAYDSLLYNYGDQFRGEVMTDDLGNCYVATCTRSADFPIVNGFGAILQGGQAGVVVKFNQDLSTLEWSTFLNGENKDAAYSLKVDGNYDVFVTGGTSSPGFPVTPGVYQNTYGGGKADAFICKIKSDGSTLIHSSFLGMANYDQAFFLEFDRHGAVHVLGQTESFGTFPVTAGVYSNANSGQFVTSIDSTLSTINYSTIFGTGNSVVDISPAAFLIDVCGNIYISGWGANILQNNPIGQMPVTTDAWSQSVIDGFGFYILVLEREAQNVIYGSYYGGGLSREHVDGGTSRFDPNGIIYQSVCAGCQNNDDFPCTTGAWSCDNLSTGCNNGVFKFDFEIKPIAEFTVDNLSGCAPLTVTFTNNSIGNTNYLWDFGNGDTTSIQPSPTRTYTDTGTYYVYLTIEDSICALEDTALQVITVYPELFLNTSNDTVICASASFDIWASGIGHDGNYHWSSNNQFTDTLNTPMTDSSITVNPVQSTYYYVMIENPNCQLIDSVFVDFTSNTLTVPLTVDVCDGDFAQITASGGTPTDSIISYDWEPDSIIVSGDGTSTVLVNPSSSQYVYVYATTQSGCNLLDSTLVNVGTYPSNVNAWVDMDTIIFGGSTGAHVLPNGNVYSWSPSGDFDNASSQHPTITPSLFGLNTYVVTVSNGNCSRSDTIQVYTFEYICDETDIFIPNAFTPNGDGNNDQLRVRSNSLTDLYFCVYDRWGELMYETNQVIHGWDGTYKNKKCDPDVYVYYLRGYCLDGEEFFKKGNVTLIR